MTQEVPITLALRYVDPAGQLTLDGYRVLEDLSRRIDATEAASGATAWGDITGTLGDQADLDAALDAKAPLASPALTGTPTAPTAAPGTNTTQVATTAFVEAAVAAGGGGSSPILGWAI